MPAKSDAYWSERAKIGPGATWYLDRWKDWYSKTIIKHSFKRVREYLEGKKILDAGCGDCWLDHWIVEEFEGTEVLGVDFYDYRPEGHDKVVYQPGIDIERLMDYGVVKWFKAEVVVVCSVLECTNDWKKALRSILSVAPVAIFFEDLRVVSPSYQRGLNYKTAITLRAFVWELGRIQNEMGWKPMVVEQFSANIIDRALFVRMPKWLWWLVAPITLVIDLLAQRLWKHSELINELGRFRLLVVKRAEDKEFSGGKENEDEGAVSLD